MNFLSDMDIKPTSDPSSPIMQNYPSHARQIENKSGMQLGALSKMKVNYSTIIPSNIINKALRNKKTEFMQKRNFAQSGLSYVSKPQLAVQFNNLNNTISQMERKLEKKGEKKRKGEKSREKGRKGEKMREKES